MSENLESDFIFFKDILQKFIDIEDWKLVYPLFTAKKLKKNTLHCRPGDLMKHVGLIKSGLFRLYYIDNKGKEYIKSFNGPGEFLGPFAEILQNQAARTYIEAMSDAEVLLVEWKHIQSLTVVRRSINELLWNALKNLYIEKEQKEYSFLNLDPFERYMEFKDRYNKYLEQIPQFYIASYLGITPEALSRILKKRAK